MQILAHRGCWEETAQHNKIGSFSAAFERGHGIELDIRAYDGQVVVSHDSPKKPHLKFSDVLCLYATYPDAGSLAINVKEDGLGEPTIELLKDQSISDYFFFDMSIPDAISYLKQCATTFTRQSEHEPQPYLYENCSGIWLDSFEGCWFSEDVIVGHMQQGKSVAVVSAELHGRDKTENWDIVDAAKSRTAGCGANLMLCTDYPDEAAEAFNV
jgi:hypothetical protein